MQRQLQVQRVERASLLHLEGELMLLRRLEDGGSPLELDDLCRPRVGELRGRGVRRIALPERLGGVRLSQLFG